MGREMYFSWWSHTLLCSRVFKACQKERRKMCFSWLVSCCYVAECSESTLKGGTCFYHGGYIRCSLAECSKSALKGGKCFSHGCGTHCSVAECSKSAKKGGK